MNGQTEHIAISYDSLLSAYMDCRRNKGGTATAIAFEIHYERELLRLRDEINAGRYEVSPSITFIVTKPTKREVFAASFRDRIVHHWIGQRIVPLLEAQFIPASFNCRKEKGTLAAVKYLQDAIRYKSENYTRDCWVLKYDLKGFFMSIDRRLVADKLCRFIRERYKGDDLETLVCLTREILLNAPENNCVIKGSESDWEGLAADKSLFTVPEGMGLPIGNLTSQLVANFLLDDTDHYLTETLGLTIDRYVDDTATVDTDKERMLLAMPLIREHLWRTARAKVHPHKFYLQHYTKGVKFLGMVVKRDRLYIANRTLGYALCRMHHFNECARRHGAPWCKANAGHFVSSINSYLGLMRHARAYGLRRAFCGMIAEEWLKYIVINRDFIKIVLRQKYKHRERVKRMLRRKRKQASRNRIPKAKRMTARVFSGETLPAVEQFNTGRNRGCIVRWDFETVKTPTESPVDKRAGFRRRKAGERARKAAAKGEPTPQPEPQTQGEPRDSGIVAFSEMRYIGIPGWERVESDIRADLSLRYGDTPWPGIDFDAYRAQITALKNA